MIFYVINTPMGGGLACRNGDDHVPLYCCKNDTCVHVSTTRRDLPCRFDYYNGDLYDIEILSFFAIVTFCAALPLGWLVLLIYQCIRNRHTISYRCCRLFASPQNIPAAFLSQVPDELIYFYIWGIWPCSIISYIIACVAAYYHNNAAIQIQQESGTGFSCTHPTCSTALHRLIMSDTCNSKIMVALTIDLVIGNFFMGLLFLIFICSERTYRPEGNNISRRSSSLFTNLDFFKREKRTPNEVKKELVFE